MGALNRCTKCKKLLPISDFKKDKRSPKGYENTCKKCCHALVLNRKQRIKAQCVEYLGGKCMKCKNKYPTAVFDFHHRNPSEKSFNIGDRGCVAFNTLKPELDKCDLLCANCHRLEHWREK